MKKLLLAFAHPDDESFACGGTIAKSVIGGWTVHVVCATRGEAGGSGPYGEVSPENLGNIRQKELEEAGKILGIASITFLGYKDGTLFGLTPGELEDKLYQQISGFAPDIVITFEPTGISNHPDHTKICLSTTYAFQTYARDVAVGLEPRLYYACMPESVATYLKKQKNIPVESFGKPWVGTPDKLITTVIDIKKFKTKKMKALASHKSQQSDVDRFLSLSKQPLLDQEYFILRMQGIHEVFMGKTDRIANRL